MTLSTYVALQVTQETSPGLLQWAGPSSRKSGRQPCWQAPQRLGGMIRVSGRDGKGGGEFGG